MMLIAANPPKYNALCDWPTTAEATTPTVHSVVKSIYIYLTELTVQHAEMPTKGSRV